MAPSNSRGNIRVLDKKEKERVKPFPKPLT